MTFEMLDLPLYYVVVALLPQVNTGQKEWKDRRFTDSERSDKADRRPPALLMTY